VLVHDFRRHRHNCNSHYVFFLVRDESDHGTLIDFLQRRQNVNLGAVRQILPALDWPVCRSPTLFPKLEPTRKVPLTRCPTPPCSRMPRTKSAMPAWGGKPNFQQPGLVQAIIARLPERSAIVAAFDADEAGDDWCNAIPGAQAILRKQDWHGIQIQPSRRAPASAWRWQWLLRGEGWA
jgi:hypothetical protein